MKVRVKKIGDYFYPQYKTFLFWHCFEETNLLSHLVNVRGEIRYCHIDEAIQYAKRAKRQYKKMHEIKENKVVWEEQ